MGLWVNTTYVNTADIAAVDHALTDLFIREGMHPIAPPPVRTRQRNDPMQYNGALENDLWGLAVFPGAKDWTVIQTAPLELLAERAPGAPAMRLATLCRTLTVAAFHFDVYDGTAAVLAEVLPDGRVAVSGFDPYARSGDALNWNGEAIAEDHAVAAFRVLPYEETFDADASAEHTAAAIAARFGGPNAQYCDNLVSVTTLIEHTPFDAPGGLVRYFKWSGPTRQRG